VSCELPESFCVHAGGLMLEEVLAFPLTCRSRNWSWWYNMYSFLLLAAFPVSVWVICLWQLTKLSRIAFHVIITSFAETNDSTFGLFFRYLASGMNFGDLEFDFKVSRKTIPGILQETCEVIWNVLQPLEMPEPNKEMSFKKSAEL